MSRKQVQISLDEKQLKLLDKFCRSYGLSRSETIRQALLEYLAEYEHWHRIELQAGEHDLIDPSDLSL